MNSLASISSAFGTIWFTILVFIAGTLIGTPLWNYLRKFLPWNKQ